MIVGIFECGEVTEELKARFGDYPAMFERLLGGADPDLAFHTIRVVSGEALGNPGDADAWLITGSRHGVYDPLPWIGPLKGFVIECIHAQIPLAGICFGHQLIAEALGGRAVKSDKGWGIGVQSYDVLQRPSWMSGMPDRYSVRAFHQDQVVALPDDATVLATSPHCEIAAVAYGSPEHPDAITVQPHPEFELDFMRALIDLREDMVLGPDVADEARKNLHAPVHSPAWGQAIVTYFRKAAAARSS